MNKSDFIQSCAGFINKAGFQLKKHSPEIFIVAGVIGTVVSAVMACKATTKVKEILDKTKSDLDTIHDCAENGSMTEKYSEEDAKKDTAIVYLQTGVKLAKLYGPAVAIGAVSISATVASHVILKSRNVSLAAAYLAIDKTLKEYRERVAERFGKEIEHELRYNIKAKKIEETILDENGKEKKVKKDINVVGIDGYSDYARFFDASSREWEKNPESNLFFLRTQERFANERLKAVGHLYLNEVYDILDIPRSKAGQIVGWVYDPKNPTGDNRVDFGIYELHRDANRDFVNGYEPVILLDFNVDGNILDLM
jgi:hypothetical protein